MHISEFPYEVLAQILEEAVKLNQRDGVSFTYGLSQPPMPLKKPPLAKNLRGPLAPDTQRWDAVTSIRRVCRIWHEWALKYALKDVFIRKGSGSERWAELAQCRQKYDLYELIDKPTGAAVYRDPWCSLRKTAELMADYPQAASMVRRMWFNGFYVYETNQRICRVLSSTPFLRSVSLPWTSVRHLGPQEWRRMLGLVSGVPLESLEFQAVDLSEAQINDPKNQVDKQAFKSGLVNFGQLRRLKIFGDTNFMPLVDADLEDIARTAKNIEEFQLSGNSTVSIRGVMALVKASRASLRVLDHSPRAQRGFAHPHPGVADSDEHICDILSSCRQLKDLSVSIPNMCAALFRNREVNWEGEVQVRAAHLCGHEHITTNTEAAQASLRQLLDAARDLTDFKARSVASRHMSVELFFAECIFEPTQRRVHGDFEPAEIMSGYAWPVTKDRSGKGPYGTSGFYGKEIAMFESVDEKEFLRGVQRHWLPIY